MSEYIEVFKRTEIKYLLSQEQYIRLMDYLKGFARIDDYGKTRINNIYFDTPNFRLVRTSLEKPVYKEKLRLRTYGKTDDGTNSFIEIKKKYDGIVYKRRISGAYKATYNYLVRGGKPIDDSQISREIEGFRMMYEGLRPAMTICYDRIAMVGEEDPDFRVTFDTNIEWNTKMMDLRYEIPGNKILRAGEYMMELKVAESMPLGLAKKLSELGIYPVSFSKYGKGYMDMIGRSKVNYKTEQETMREYERGVVAYA